MNAFFNKLSDRSEWMKRIDKLQNTHSLDRIVTIVDPKTLRFIKIEKRALYVYLDEQKTVNGIIPINDKDRINVKFDDIELGQQASNIKKWLHVLNDKNDENDEQKKLIFDAFAKKNLTTLTRKHRAVESRLITPYKYREMQGSMLFQQYSKDYAYYRFLVTPQVRHPERSEGSQIDHIRATFRRSFTAFRMT